MTSNDVFFEDLDASACYGDGAVNPSQILIPQIDADALTEFAGNIRSAGRSIGTSGNDIVSTWGGLDGAYVAPESEQLLSAVDRVATDGDTVETGTDGLATALIDFAGEVRAFKSLFHSLRGGATEMRTKINADEDWQKDEDLVEEHNALLEEINTANADWLTAQLACANTITALFDGPTFTTYDGMEGDGYSGNEIPFGFSEIPEGMDMPWGNPQNVSKHWTVDVWDGVADIAVGAAQDVAGVTGLWHDKKWGVPIFGEQGRTNFTNYMDENLEGLSILTGFYDPSKPDGERWGVEDFGEWVDNFVPAIREVGQGIVPTDEWDDRKAYVLTQGAINVGLIVGGVALSVTVVGAPAGVPMLLAGLRTGLRGANNVGTMDIPSFHNDVGFHLPGVSNLNLSRINSGGGGGDGGFWNSLPGGAWLANIADLRGTARNLDNGPLSTNTPDGAPVPSRVPDDAGQPRSDRAPDDQNRTNDDEIDTQVSASEIDTLLRDVEDYTRRHAEDPDMLLEEINRRQGSEVVDPIRAPELVGARTGDGPSASSNSTFTNSSGSGGSGVDTPTGRSSTSAPDGGPSGRGGSSGGSPGGGNGSGHLGGGTGNTSSSGDLTPNRSTPGRPTETVPLLSDDNRLPGKKQRFDDTFDVEPNKKYEIRDSDGTLRESYTTDSNGDIVEIRTESRPNSRHPELMDPRPNATYHVKVGNNEYVFKTDSHGRTVYAEGDLEPGRQKRNNDEQSDVNTMGDRYFELLNEQLEAKFELDHGRKPNPGEVPLWDRPQWNGGHIFGSSEFRGPGERLNQVPMLDIVNQERKTLPGIQGSFRRAEWTWHGLLSKDTKALQRGLGDNYEAQMAMWKSILDAGPNPPNINVKVSFTHDPNLKPIIDPKTGKELPPPPSEIVVDWSLNGIKQDQLSYDNLPDLPAP
ncbi:hypothetical protein BDW27_110106 [Nocardiopsis sp. L17-MgMaSL7]|nr:hypothetical protein BDW27_110106 [Nocardiopsis sp. L17-MgMaSL7]